MMCASELVIVRNAALMKWEKEKAESFSRLAEASIHFCETKIGPELEKLALNPKGGIISTSYSLAITWDTYNNKVLCPICADGKRYADGTISRKADTSMCYSQEVIEQYLKDHCLTVEWKEAVFLRYGCGNQPATELKVSVK